MNYIINKNCVYEYEIKKSKFISLIYSINSTLQIKNILEDLKKEYSDATHICYAYVLKEDGIKEKAVDNGEPSGTAGKPILDCIKKNNMVNTLIVVIRYFGGIKLGAGGLVRAYNSSAKFVIEENKQYIVPYIEYENITLEIKYNKFEEFKNFCNKNNINIINSKFKEKVEVEISFKKGSDFNFESYKN